jgi:protease YdgD
MKTDSEDGRSPRSIVSCEAADRPDRPRIPRAVDCMKVYQRPPRALIFKPSRAHSRMLRTVWISTVVFWISVVATSGFDARGSDLRPGILGNDDRVRVLDEAPGWQAIGQVNVAGYRTMKKCTGTLVAPDRVVTAAHCVRRAPQAPAVPADHIHFLAGVRGPTHKGHATAKCVRFPLKGATPATTHSAQSTSAPGRDIAVIILKRPLSVSPILITEGAAVADQRLIHAAYAADRRYALSAHFGCRIVGISRSASLWFTNCDTHPASSGGPLLLKDGNDLNIAAIMLGASSRHDVTVALPIARLRRPILETACP